jgi:iron-sulfur cluster insertion protein
MTLSISITQSASDKILSLQDNKPQHRLRIKVLGGGCSGFQYEFTMDDQQFDDDHIFTKNNAQVIIDALSLDFLKDSILDYSQDLTKSSFVIQNPNSTTSCGCGKSFSI